MNLLHVGLTCSSEEKTDKFYLNLLGLKKSEPKALPAEISAAIFGINSELTMINYVGESAHFEIFVYRDHQSSPGRIDHVCLEVGDLEGFLQKCRKSGVDIIQIPKGESLITFIKDFDGNLFEIKRK